MVSVCLSVRRDEPWAVRVFCLFLYICSTLGVCCRIPYVHAMSLSLALWVLERATGSGPPNQTSLVEGCLPRGPHTPLAALASAKKGSFRVPNVFSEITLSPALLWVDSKWWWSMLGMLTHTAPQREPESLRVGGSPPRTEAEPTTTWGA